MDAAGLCGDEHQAGPLDDLADVNDREALGALFNPRGKELCGKIGLTAGKHFLEGALRTAAQDFEVDAVLSVEALFKGNVIAGKLGLRKPLGQEGRLLQAGAPGCRRHEKPCREKKQEPQAGFHFSMNGHIRSAPADERLL
jgi:hypothetical protein